MRHSLISNIESLKGGVGFVFVEDGIDARPAGQRAKKKHIETFVVVLINFFSAAT